MASRIRLYIATSLDGHIATSDGDVAWLEPSHTGDYGCDDRARMLRDAHQVALLSMRYFVGPHPEGTRSFDPRDSS